MYSFPALVILAGHFKSALYCSLRSRFSPSRAWSRSPARWLAHRSHGAGPARCPGTLTLGHRRLTGLELAAYSIRTAQHAILDSFSDFVRRRRCSRLSFRDFYGAASDNYHGPADITQYYFSAGILLLPLAVWGAPTAGCVWLADCYSRFRFGTRSGPPPGSFY